MKSSTILRVCVFACLLLSSKASSRAQTTSSLDSALPLRAPISLDGLQPTHDPLIHKDSASGTLFYVESDGRHVSAIDKEGKLIWCTDLSAGLTTMTRRPHIERPTSISSEAGDTHLCISFGATDTAIIDVATGKLIDIIHD